MTSLVQQCKYVVVVIIFGLLVKHRSRITEWTWFFWMALLFHSSVCVFSFFGIDLWPVCDAQDANDFISYGSFFVLYIDMMLVMGVLLSLDTHDTPLDLFVIYYSLHMALVFCAIEYHLPNEKMVIEWLKDNVLVQDFIALNVDQDYV
jgi:hypothetical protein